MEKVYVLLREGNDEEVFVGVFRSVGTAMEYAKKEVKTDTLEMRPAKGWSRTGEEHILENCYEIFQPRNGYDYVWFDLVLEEIK